MFAAWIIALLLIQPVAAQTDIIVTDGGKMVGVIRPQDVAMPDGGPPLIDSEKLRTVIAHLAHRVEKRPINAMISSSGDIIPGKKGQTLNQSDFRTQFSRTFYSDGLRRVSVPLLATQPRVDGELLGRIRTKQVSSYATRFNSANSSRSYNIQLASEALNNHVVFPGETFSFNQTVGPRTAAKGYKKAKIIVRGEYSEGLGGGICQVSSTLFNAVDEAGLRVTQRFSHSKRVSYVPPGRDATVSWYGPDFRFTNNYNQPILIRAHAANGWMTLALYSSDVIRINRHPVPRSPRKLPKEKPSRPKSIHPLFKKIE
ncbi:MAG: VanW family protein [Sporolactobacillus sp.]